MKKSTCFKRSIGARSIDDFQSIAAYARDRVNPYLFNYALSVALLHRADTKDVELPSLIETFPSKFLDTRTVGKLREEATVVPEGSRMPIVSTLLYILICTTIISIFRLFLANSLPMIKNPNKNYGTSVKIWESTSTIGIGICCTPSIHKLTVL